MHKEKLLIVDDEKDIVELLLTIFDTGYYETMPAYNGHSAISLAIQFQPSVILLDFMLPDMDGLEVLKKIKNLLPHTEVIMITGRGSEQIAVELMKAGAVEYITKPFDYNVLRQKVSETIELRREKIKKLEREENRLQKENLLYKELQKNYSFDFVGVSQTMKSLISKIKVIAHQDVTVLIRGESGTGKELIARIIHSQSKRKDKPLLTMNCATITETLIESELFGHEKGAFTGADYRRLGKFELANGGTLFLDEIGDMSLITQAKVLRVIQEHQFERVGGEKTIKTDIRLITATHRNLEKMCRESKFREDLFYRINVHPIKIPPLVERTEDIPVLFDYFIKKYSSEFSKYIENVSNEVYDRLLLYTWPGNVRELKNIVERMVMLATTTKLTELDLPDEIITINNAITGAITSKTLKEIVNNCKRKALLNALQQCNGNRTKAAKLLGVSLRHVQNLISKFNLEKKI